MVQPKLSSQLFIQKILLPALFISLLPPVFSQTKNCSATLCGVVTDAETQQPIPYAEIFIQEIGRGEITDEKGSFHFHDLCEGVYTVSCSHIGCNHLAKEVLVKGDAKVNFELKHVAMELGEIVVRETFVAPSPAQAQRELFGNSLNTAAGRTLGDALQQLPGVTSLNTGATLSKPVIRGLHSNRVLMLNSGVRQEGQQWGQEHAPEIDPLTAGRVTVVMGANSVRYGAEALGGVILVEPEHLLLHKGIAGKAILAGFSNGKAGIASARLDAKASGSLPLAGSLQASLKRSGNLRSPGYFLENTSAEERNLSATLGLQKHRFQAEVFYNYFFTTIGIFEASHVETPDDLQEAIQRGRPLENGSFSYDLHLPKQQVAHHILKAKGSLRTADNGKLIFQYARQFNRRQEFEEDELGHTHEHDEPATQLELTTHTADFAWEHKPWLHTQGSLGFQYMRQVGYTPHGDLLPHFDSHTAGIFWTEHWRKRPFPLEFEAGLRYDLRRLHIDRRGDEPIDKTLFFNNLSGTFGTIYRFPKHLKLLLHLGSAWRAPSPNELYSDGVHHGSASYELGRHNLHSERAYSANLTLDFNSRKNDQTLTGIRANFSLYRNYIDHFIYLQPQPQPVVTDEGTFPAFHYEQTPARLQGLDWNAEWMPTPRLALNTGGSVLRTLNRNTDEPLALMPSDRFRHSATWFFGKKQPEDRPFLRLTMVNVLRQKRAPELSDFAPPPAAFTLLHFDAGTTFSWAKQNTQVGLSLQNVFNTSYREYLNRFRYFASEPGRNLALWVKTAF